MTELLGAEEDDAAAMRERSWTWRTLLSGEEAVEEAIRAKPLRREKEAEGPARRA